MGGPIAMFLCEYKQHGLGFVHYGVKRGERGGWGGYHEVGREIWCWGSMGRELEGGDAGGHDQDRLFTYMRFSG